MGVDCSVLVKHKLTKEQIIDILQEKINSGEIDSVAIYSLEKRFGVKDNSTEERWDKKKVTELLKDGMRGIYTSPSTINFYADFASINTGCKPKSFREEPKIKEQILRQARELMELVEGTQYFITMDTWWELNHMFDSEKTYDEVYEYCKDHDMIVYEP